MKMKKEFDFKFFNKVMYVSVIIVLFYILKNLGVIEKLIEINAALIPVYVGIVICFLSMPLANKLRKSGVNKKLSAIISLVIIYSILGILLSIIIPMFIEQLTKLVANFPDIYRVIVTKLNGFIHNNLALEQSINLTDDIKNLDVVKDYLGNILNYSINTLQSAFSFLISIFTTIVVSFFLVKDMEDIKSKFVNYFSKNGTNKGRYNLINEIDVTIMSYVKGVTIDSIVVGILTTILCLILGIDYAIIFGILITVLNFIPYIGALLSEIIIALFALTMNGPLFALLTFALCILIQIIDSNILQPNIVAKSVDLHPVIVFVGIIVGSILMGIFGMIIAVPVLAILKIIIKYKASKSELINKKVL
jgi:predicted PurR-regulated permease PerM